MAKAQTGANIASVILISMARAKKESIEKKNNLASVYDSLMETLKEYIDTEEENGWIQKRILSLNEDLEFAEEDDENEVSRIEKEIVQLSSLKKNIEKTFEELETIKNNCNPRDLNSVLSERMREIYKEQELCPYCLGQNPNCGFFSEVSNENKGDIYNPEKKEGYEEQDKEGRAFLNEFKDELKGEKVEITIENKEGKPEKFEFDLGENMSIQDHHINSYDPYVENSTVSIAGKRHGFNINKNSADEQNCGLDNIISLPSIATKGGVKVTKGGNEYNIPWSILTIT